MRLIGVAIGVLGEEHHAISGDIWGGDHRVAHEVSSFNEWAE
jgi:hypothetical protein